MTDKTSYPILLNSSKQLQQPPLANPLKNFSMDSKLNELEQLKTKHILPILRAISFIVSVFPVPAGPSIDAPYPKWRAMKTTCMHLSVNGVSISL